MLETQRLADKWQNMIEEDQQVYVTQSINDKKRYKKEMDLFVQQYTSIDLTEDLESENNNNKEKRTIEDSTECVICMDNPKQALIMPCLHVSSCIDCSLALDKCPICRGNIDTIKKIYIS